MASTKPPRLSVQSGKESNPSLLAPTILLLGLPTGSVLGNSPLGRVCTKVTAISLSCEELRLIGGFAFSCSHVLASWDWGVEYFFINLSAGVNIAGGHPAWISTQIGKINPNAATIFLNRKLVTQYILKPH